MGIRIKKSLFALVCVLLISVAQRVQAQSVPGSVDTGRFSERFDVPLSHDDGAVYAPQDYRIDSPIPEATTKGFVLESVALTGLSVFKAEDFKNFIDDYLGRTVDLPVLRHLAARIRAHYRQRGYILCDVIVPVQAVEKGAVRFQVIEGHVHDVLIDDAEGVLESDGLGITKEVVARIKALNPLHGPTLERYILLINESPNIELRSILRLVPNALQPGAINVTLKVLKQPSQFILGYNNHGSKFTGPHQIEAAYITGRLLNPYDIVSFQLNSSVPAREVKYGLINYSTPLSANGLHFESSVSYADSAPGLFLRELEVESRSFSFKAGLRYSLIRSRRVNLNVAAAFNIIDTSTDFLGEELIDDKIREVVLSVNYRAYDDWSGINGISFELHKGLDVLGARETGSDNLSRAQGRSDFVKIEASLSRIQTLPKEFTLWGQLEGQYTPHALLSSMEFGYGGSVIGRAYDPSEIIGDQGVSAGLELRYTGVPVWADYRAALTPFVFYDIGKVWNKDRNTPPVSGASAGFGAYYRWSNAISGSFVLAYPLTKNINTPVTSGSNGPRFLFQINTGF